jgi:hypothetical protein
MNEPNDKRMIRIWFVKFGAIRVVRAFKTKNPLTVFLGSGLLTLQTIL